MTVPRDDFEELLQEWMRDPEFAKAYQKVKRRSFLKVLPYRVLRRLGIDLFAKVGR